MSRIIVTGGAGRLGRSVVAVSSAAGHDVTSVDLAAVPGMLGRQIEHDLMDVDATRGLFESIRPDAVVHLAAIAVPFSRSDHEVYGINTQIAFSVLEAAVACGADRLIAASSLTVIGYGAPHGWSPVYLPIDEDHPVAPWHGYSASKEALERILAMGLRRDGGRLRTAVFRPCFVISPEEWLGAPTQQGHTVVERLRDPALSAVALFGYLDARDAASFVLAWLASDDAIQNGTVFVVGADDALALEPLAELLPRHVRGVGDRAAGLTGTRPAFDASRARRLLDWRPQHSWRTELPSGSIDDLKSDDR